MRPFWSLGGWGFFWFSGGGGCKEEKRVKQLPGKLEPEVAATAQGHCKEVRAVVRKVATTRSHRGDPTVTATSSGTVYARMN